MCDWCTTLSRNEIFHATRHYPKRDNSIFSNRTPNNIKSLSLSEYEYNVVTICANILCKQVARARTDNYSENIVSHLLKNKKIYSKLHYNKKICSEI